jgi:hypothetical protein
MCRGRWTTWALQVNRGQENFLLFVDCSPGWLLCSASFFVLLPLFDSSSDSFTLLLGAAAAFKGRFKAFEAEAFCSEGGAQLSSLSCSSSLSSSSLSSSSLSSSSLSSSSFF